MKKKLTNLEIVHTIFLRYDKDFGQSPLEGVEDKPNGLEFIFNDVFLDKLKNELGDEADESLQLFLTKLMKDALNDTQ